MEDINFYDNRMLMKIHEIIEKDFALIVLCGMSGTGKTTFARHISDKFQDHPVKYFAIDDYKDKNYRKFGFHNKDERLIFRDLAIAEFKVDVMREINKGKCSVIIDYPFEKEWQAFFDFLTKKESSQYKLVIVNFGIPSRSDECNEIGKRFDRIWKRRVERDLSIGERRSASLVSKSYQMNDDGSENFIIDENKFSDDNKNRLLEKYKNGKFNAITGDFIFFVD